MTVLARIIAPHNRNLDYHEWITLGERVQADCTGRLNPRVMIESWTVFRCNNSQCPGEARVSDYNAVFAIEEAEASLPPAP